MGDGGGVEERLPVAGAGVDLEAGIGAARVEPQLHHLAAGEEVFIELHLCPVVHPEVVGLV